MLEARQAQAPAATPADLAADASAEPAPLRRWPAELELELRRRAGLNRVGHVAHRGPLRIQRAFHPESDGTAHVVVLHPPGGCVGGDRLRVRAVVGAGARALLTTPGAGKIYRTNGFRAELHTELRVGAGAALEHVPQEMVVFDGAEASLRTEVHLGEGASFLGWEVVCLGRPAAGEAFARGALRFDFTVRSGQCPLFVEAGAVNGGGAFLDAAWGLRGAPAFGTLVATGDVDLAAVRRTLGSEGAATRLDTAAGALLVVRALGPDGTRVRATLERARHHVRDAWGRPRIDPGIWRS